MGFDTGLMSRPVHRLCIQSRPGICVAMTDSQGRPLEGVGEWVSACVRSVGFRNSQAFHEWMTRMCDERALSFITSHLIFVAYFCIVKVYLLMLIILLLCIDPKNITSFSGI